jgi:hypothetical protein
VLSASSVPSELWVWDWMDNLKVFPGDMAEDTASMWSTRLVRKPVWRTAMAIRKKA